MPDIPKEAILAELRELAKGRIIESGWASLKVMVIEPDTPESTVADFRRAFMCGSYHMLGLVDAILRSYRLHPAHRQQILQIEAEMKLFGVDLAYDAQVQERGDQPLQ